MNARREVQSYWAKVRRFDSENLEAAEIILRNIHRYGDGSGLVRWARMVLARIAEQAAA